MEHGLIGTTREKLDALNKKRREAFGKETYTLNKSEWEQYTLPPHKKTTFLADMGKPSQVAMTSEKAVNESIPEEKPFAFLPGILGDQSWSPCSLIMIRYKPTQTK